ncbi:MAG: hypothetical protein NT133_20040 [Alphaproteobacteria bacterium]|nr:hypothetical protein [Alphaproteobacteria bacterium]
MTEAEFRASLADAAPPAGISQALAGLWWDAKGDWAKSHECAQTQADTHGNALHAYLHRKEPDLANAAHWYRRAGRAMPTGSFEAEWEALLAENLR